MLLPLCSSHSSQLIAHQSATAALLAVAGRHRQPSAALLLAVHFGVSLPFVGARKFAATNVTAKWLLARVGAHMGGQVIGAGEGAHADFALKLGEETLNLQYLLINQDLTDILQGCR